MMGRKLSALLMTATLTVTFLAIGLAQPTSSSRDGNAGASQNKQEEKPQPVHSTPASRFQQLQRGLGRPDTTFIARLLESARAGGASVLSTGDSFDDFASVVQGKNGTVYAAYAAYYNGHDQIRLHSQLPDGEWSMRVEVPLVNSRADIWMPQLAIDKQDCVWVVWCEQTGQSEGVSGNWDLYARPFDGKSWGPIVRISEDARPDINPHVATDAAGNIHVVWQAHPNNNGDIHYSRFDGKEWSKPLAVTSDAESDWYPHVTVDAEGQVWIAFDSYRNGDYDVFLTSLSPTGRLGKIIPIATSSFYEAHASVACTPDGRVWVSWEQGGHNWGKDQGYWLVRENRDRGTTLGGTRKVRVACFDNEKLWAGPEITDLESRNLPSGSTTLACGPDGRLWLRFRHMFYTRLEPEGEFTGFGRRWLEYVTYLTKEGWAKPIEVPASAGRISVFSRICPAEDGSLYIAYSSDARAMEFYHRPVRDTALVMHIPTPAVAPGSPELQPYQAPELPAVVPAWNASQESREVAAIRGYRANFAGMSHRIVRGDLHRHTELSWDVGPSGDGSYLDFYRYMIDVAVMDFGGITDHQGGGHYAYWWWLTEKSCDMYYLAPRFVPLYGYERSLRFPNGHRNIFHAYRGVPIFPFQEKLGQRGAFPGVQAEEFVDNDTKLLYQALRRSNGIAISHTSGTPSMGTDWRDNDPVVEPVVEIYQGARNSYETLGAPRVHPADEPPDKAPGGFQAAGLVWKAYEKGYRLGTIASSDHGSTHISYSLVFTPENDRKEILESIRRRKTYGATDNLIVDFRANGHFMGDEFSTGEKPSLTLQATGTASIDKIDLIRNNEYIYTTEPKDRTVDISYRDMEPTRGTNLYYFRIVQEDGEIAWCSPIWVNYTGP